MTNQTAISNAVNRGVRKLAEEQLSNGGFVTYWSRSRSMTPATACDSPFITGLIIDILYSVAAATPIIVKTIDYLTFLRRRSGLCAFFDEGIDPDLDDTCLINLNLQRHAPDAFDYAKLARNIASLTLPDHRFHTWIREGEKQDNDIDACVCVNVIRYLINNGIETNRNWLIAELRNWQAGKDTLYYVQPYMLLYLVCQLPDANLADILHRAHFQTAIVEQERHCDLLDAALRLIVLSKMGGDRHLKSALAGMICRQQLKSGLWPSVGCFQAFNYWGSASLTTAACIRALTDV